MRTTTRYVCLGLGLLLGAPALARPEKERPREEATYPTRTHYEFDDDLVEGGLENPDGTIVGTRLPAKHTSLIKLRNDFVPELIKSAEDF
jgi:hypothetical protein